jgi:glyoxalase superfamily protein
MVHHRQVNSEGDGPIGWIREIVLDCTDPWDLARFWARLLGGTPTEWYPGWVTLEPPPHGQRLSFQGIAGARDEDSAATRSGNPKVHFDVLVADLADAHDRVIAAGGSFLGEHVSPRHNTLGHPVPWRVYADPAGHPFCLVVR